MFIPDSTLTFKNAHAVMRQGEVALLAGQQEIDFSHIISLDSTAVAVALSWCKTAQKYNINLRFLNFSENLLSLARLYGVESLLLAKSA